MHISSDCLSGVRHLLVSIALLIYYFLNYKYVKYIDVVEMANAGRPLFPGNDVEDQLKRIFKYPFCYGTGEERR